MADANGEHVPERFAVVLPRELEEFVRGLVADGRFPDAADVIAEALFWFRGHYEAEQARLAKLKAAVQTGIEQADRGELTDGPSALARLRAKLGAAESKPR